MNRDIRRWLSPSNQEPEYYQEHFKNEEKKRFPETCKWILDNESFKSWCGGSTVAGSASELTVPGSPSDSTASDSASVITLSASAPGILWISAIPGAGKSVLASFLVNNVPDFARRTRKIHFFCDNTDTTRNSAVEVLRSLVYQLYTFATHEHASFDSLLSETVQRSTQGNATQLQTLWGLFEAFIAVEEDKTALVVVIDALDECNDRKHLIKCFANAAHSHPQLKVLFTSRREEDICHHMSNLNIQEIRLGQKEVDSDIALFLEGKIEKPRYHRLRRNPSVKALVLKRLKEGSQGMFLWAA